MKEKNVRHNSIQDGGHQKGGGGILTGRVRLGTLE